MISKSSKLLVPVDFSESSATALRYACGFAKRFDCRIMILHVIESNHALPILPLDSKTNPFDDEKQRVNLQMEKWVKKIIGSAEIHYTLICKFGNVTDMMLVEADKIKPLFVIMGAMKASKANQNYFSNNAAVLIEKCKYPVFILPENTKWTDPTNILIASDYNSTDITILKKLLQIYKKKKLHVSLLHMSDHELKNEIELSDIDYFIRKMKDKTGHEDISGVLLYGEDPAEKLKKYADKNKPDLLVVTKIDKGTLGRLMRKSISVELALSAKTPLLVYHSEKKPFTWT